MACSHPLKAWQTGLLTPKGKPLYFITRARAGFPRVSEAEKHLGEKVPFNSEYCFASDGVIYLKSSLDIPCGHCAGCLSDRVRDWSVRLMLESSKYTDNHFLTLTYDNEHLPKDLKLDKSHIQLFMKRLRARFPDTCIRFFACGEIGSLGRPHYHMILFNLALDDLELYSSGENPLYRSAVIDRCWQKGAVIIGAVSDKSCAYVARYCVKKLRDKDESFLLMSRRPGIGSEYLQSHKYDILKTDKIYFPFNDSFHTAKPPRYFDKLCEKEFSLDGIKDLRKIKCSYSLALNYYLSGAVIEDDYFRWLDGKNKDKERRLNRRRYV